MLVIHTDASNLDDNTVEVSYENLNPLREDEADMDTKRRLLFTVGSYTFMKINFFRRTAVGTFKESKSKN